MAGFRKRLLAAAFQQGYLEASKGQLLSSDAAACTGTHYYDIYGGECQCLCP